MSFSSEVKKELVGIPVVEDCCQKALAYGLLLFSRSFTRESMLLQTESEAVAGVYSEVLQQTAGIMPQVRQSTAGTFQLQVDTPEQRLKVLRTFFHEEAAVTLRINRANLQEECCISAFLRGVFLACGTITNPERDYHMEFAAPFFKLSQDLLTLLQEVDLRPKELRRKGYYILYYKESEAVEDLLTLMGATHSTLEIMGIKIYKDLRNKANRVTNCETANINKVVEASLQQIQAIQWLQRHHGLDKLPEELREIAYLRLENPEMSLRELGELLKKPLSRSGINHRMKRLLAYMEETKVSEKD